MLGKYLAAVALLLALVAAPPPAIAADDLVVRASKYPVKETMDRLVKALEEKGLKPALRVDHAAAAKANGLELRPTEVVLFGNPKLGTPLMQADPRIGIDLPMRVLAWQDAAGKTWIAYTRPEALAARYGIASAAEPLKAMAGALDAFAKAAAD